MDRGMLKGGVRIMKAMILVLSPRESRDLLNGDLSVLVRKKFPKDYVGWVYVYCTKGKVYMRPYLVKENDFNDHMTMLYDKDFVPKPKEFELYDFRDGGFSAQFFDFYDGKVVARFWCDKVEYIENYYDEWRDGEEDYRTEILNPNKLYEKSCLPFEEMDKYLKGDYGYAIHVTKPKPFDKPKEIKEFYHHFTLKRCERRFSNTNIEIDDKTGGLRQPTKHGYEYVYPLTSAPRSGWCYVEV